MYLFVAKGHGNPYAEQCHSALEFDENASEMDKSSVKGN